MSSPAVTHPEGEPSGEIIVDGGRAALDRVLEALSQEQDRHVLYHLVDNESAEFDELVDVVAAAEIGTSAEVARDDERTEIRTKLHHVRLPKLEDLGVVEYDKRNGAVRYRSPPPHFEEFLQLAQHLEED